MEEKTEASITNFRHIELTVSHTAIKWGHGHIESDEEDAWTFVLGGVSIISIRLFHFLFWKYELPGFPYIKFKFLNKWTVYSVKPAATDLAAEAVIQA